MSSEVVGYELLFRSREAQAIPSPEGATASVVLNAFTEIGLERIVGDRTAWINVSRDFILSGLTQTLPAGRVRLELLEDQLLDDQLIEALNDLSTRGYRIALDDFEYTEDAEPLMDLVDVIKLDVRALGPDGMTDHVARLRRDGVKLLAEKVETQEDYAFCADLGCELFQGYFFCRPELLRDREIAASRLSLLEVIAALQDPGVDLAQLERLVARVRARGIEVTLTDRARELLGNLGYDPTYGARPLKRVIAKRLIDPLALAILEGDFREGDTVRVDAGDGELVLSVAEKVAPAAA